MRHACNSSIQQTRKSRSRSCEHVTNHPSPAHSLAATAKEKRLTLLVQLFVLYLHFYLPSNYPYTHNLINTAMTTSTFMDLNRMASRTTAPRLGLQIDSRSLQPSPESLLMLVSAMSFFDVAKYTQTPSPESCCALARLPRVVSRSIASLD